MADGNLLNGPNRHTLLKVHVRIDKHAAHLHRLLVHDGDDVFMLSEGRVIRQRIHHAVRRLCRRISEPERRDRGVDGRLEDERRRRLRQAASLLKRLRGVRARDEFALDGDDVVVGDDDAEGGDLLADARPEKVAWVYRLEVLVGGGCRGRGGLAGAAGGGGGGGVVRVAARAGARATVPTWARHGGGRRGDGVVRVVVGLVERAVGSRGRESEAWDVGRRERPRVSEV